MAGILLVALSGFLGTTAMIGIMALIHKLKWSNADMVRAIGSLYTRSHELSLVPGLLAHYSAGLLFAFGYAVICAFAPVRTPGSVVIISMMTGLVHGLTVGLLIEVVVAEHHPVEEFRTAGFPVVIAHLVGHIIYGTTIGICMASFWPVLKDYMDDFTHLSSGTDLMGFAIMWFPLFGIPLMFIGYVTYSVLTSEVRARAHQLEEDHLKKPPIKATGNYRSAA